MVDVTPVILKFWPILESFFSKVLQFFFLIFIDFIVIWRFLIELRQTNDWQLLLLERSKRLKSRQFALRDLLISCQFYVVVTCTCSKALMSHVFEHYKIFCVLK